MKVLMLYQDIQSGAKLATESIVSAYKKSFPQDHLIIYKQKAHRFTGPFAYLRNILWSMYDFWHVLQHAESVDVLVSTLYTFALPWLTSSRRNIPAIFHIHGDQRFFTQPTDRNIASYGYHLFVGWLVAALQKFAVRVSTRLAFVTPHARDNFLASIQSPSYKTKAFVLPNGVDTTIFKPIFPSSKRESTPLRVGYVGRLDEKKGVHQLIDSLQYIHRSTILSIAYPTPSDIYEKTYFEKLFRAAKKCPTRHVVQFIENAPSINEVYSNIDYLVLPSQQEMFPLVILEALAAKVLPITTNAGDIGILLSQISPLLLIDKPSPQTIARAITTVADLSQPMRETLQKKGKNIARSYSWTKSASVLRREALAILHR